MIWQKNLRRTSTMGRSHRRHKHDLKSWRFWRFIDPWKTKPLFYTYVRCDDCELSFVWCFFDSHKVKSISSKLLFVLRVSLPTSLISHHKTFEPHRWRMKLDWYSLNRRLSRRQSYGFRTWKITSGAIWFQGSMRFNTLFSALQKVLQPGGKCIKPYKDLMEQELGRNSRRPCWDHVLPGSTMIHQEINLVPARFAEK